MMMFILKRGDYRLGQGEVEHDCEYACQLFRACSANAPSNTAGARGLEDVDLIKDLSHVGLGEREHPILWVGDGLPS